MMRGIIRNRRMTIETEDGASDVLGHSRRLVIYSTVVTYIFSFALFASILFFPTAFVVSGLYEHYAPTTARFFNIAFACFFIIVSILAIGATYIQSRYFRKKDSLSRLQFTIASLIVPLILIALCCIIKWILWIAG